MNKKPKYFLKGNSPHVLSYNPAFLNDPDFMPLFDDFQIDLYQAHMRETKGKPTKKVTDFIKSTNSSPVPEKLAAEQKDTDNKANETVVTSATLSMVESEVIDIDKIAEQPQVRQITPKLPNLIVMKKSDIIKIGEDIGVKLNNDMLRRDMIAKVKTFFDEKEKIRRMEEIEKQRFPRA